MNDTSPEMTKKMREMIRAKTPQERLKMGCSMFDFSKRLVIRSLLEKSPGLSSAQLRRELFLRFYGNDFSPANREKIIRYLSGNK
jgi:hypothetical protein